MTDTNPESTHVLVSNRSCTIEQIDDGVVRCTTRGRTGTWVMFILGIVLVYGSIALIALYLPQGMLEPVSLASGVTALLLGLFLQWRGMRRRREIGSYLIDQNERVIQKAGAMFGVPFDDVAYVRTIVDIADLTRPDLLPDFPRWLFVHFKDGTHVRIGKGSKEELNPVLVWLKTAGLPVTLEE